MIWITNKSLHYIYSLQDMFFNVLLFSATRASQSFNTRNRYFEIFLLFVERGPAGLREKVAVAVNQHSLNSLIFKELDMSCSSDKSIECS